MNYEKIRKEVLEASLKSNKLGLIHGTSGNISVRDKENNVFAITPSGREYETMKPGDIAICDLDGNWIEGEYKPSIEAMMHAGVYKNRDDVNAVVHTHSKFATIMSMRDGSLPRATLPACMYYPINIAAPFYMAGTQELADCVVETLGDRIDVVIIKNHSLLATGKDIDAAMTCAIYTEEGAEAAYYCVLAGFDDYIPEEEAINLNKSCKGE